MAHTRSLPRLPEIGRPEHYYVHCVHEAERYRDENARAANKVGQYVTRAVLYCNSWEEKERCYRHALKHHCISPMGSSEEIIGFYGSLAQLVREYAGQDILKYASAQDDGFASRLRAGEPRATIVRDASAFFHKLLPTERKPEFLNMEDYQQLKILRQQWLG